MVLSRPFVLNFSEPEAALFTQSRIGIRRELVKIGTNILRKVNGIATE